VSSGSTMLQHMCSELRLFAAVGNKGLPSMTTGEFVADMLSKSVDWVYILNYRVE
jgi:hypothetical protein